MRTACLFSTFVILSGWLAIHAGPPESPSSKALPSSTDPVAKVKQIKQLKQEKQIAAAQARLKNAPEDYLVGQWFATDLKAIAECQVAGFHILDNRKCRVAMIDQQSKIRIKSGTYEVVGRAVQMTLGKDDEKIITSFLIDDLNEEFMNLSGEMMNLQTIQYARQPGGGGLGV